MSGSTISEQDKKLLNVKSIHFDKILFIDCYYNKASLPELKIVFRMNEAQKRLMLCLLQGISSKQDIMQIVWNDSHLRLRDNNYHQLVFQMRALLIRNGLPAELIMTIPHYGLKLNEPLLRSLVECHSPPVNAQPGDNSEATPYAQEISERNPKTECSVTSKPGITQDTSPVKHWLQSLVFFTRLYFKKH